MELLPAVASKCNLKFIKLVFDSLYNNSTNPHAVDNINIDSSHNNENLDLIIRTSSIMNGDRNYDRDKLEKQFKTILLSRFERHELEQYEIFIHGEN